MSVQDLALIETIQRSITAMLHTVGPPFLQFGFRFFLSLATIRVAWLGIRWALRGHGLGPDVFDFVQLLLTLSVGYAMIMFYETPIPGIGISFTNLITDQAAYFARILDARSIENISNHLDAMFARFQQPSIYNLTAILLYWSLLLVVVASKFLSIVPLALGLIGSAAGALVGPIFVPFFIVPQLEFIFWGWFKAFIQWTFMPVFSLVVLLLFESYIYNFLTTLPPGIVEWEFVPYVMQSLVVLGTFAISILFVPFLTASYFSGHVSSAGAGLMSFMTRRV